jgi:hypothetical protein
MSPTQLDMEPFSHLTSLTYLKRTALFTDGLPLCLLLLKLRTLHCCSYNRNLSPAGRSPSAP